MLTFFKINDPYRMVFIFLLLLLIRIPILVSGVPLILPELKWLLIGERLGSSGFSMYQDVWDYTAPFATLVYKWLFILFGKSRWPYQIVSMVLVIVQAGIFNKIMLRNKAYNQKTYVPALMYMLFMNSFFDFLTLSPVLMSITFVFLALSSLLKRMDNQVKDELFIKMGLCLGIASLFFLPSIFYLLVTIISLAIFTSVILRRMLLLMYSFLLTWSLTALFYYHNDAFLTFQHHYLKSIWVISSVKYLTFVDYLLLVLVPVVIFIISIYKTKKLGRYINYQQKVQRLMLLTVFSGGFAMIMVKEETTYQLIYFVPAVSFFVAHYLLEIRKSVVAEFTFMLITVLIVLNNLFPLNNWFFINQFVNYNSLLVRESPYSDLLEGKKILVVGEELSHYQNASLSTPYLDWQLSQIQLKNLNYYDNSAEIFTNFKREMPQVIIDEEGILPSIFNIMPTISACYVQHEEYKELYLLRTSN